MLMRIVKTLLITLAFAVGVLAQTQDQRNEPSEPVRAFYNSFNAHSFENAETYTTEDWNHINPFGGWTRGREAVLKELKEVHSTFLKGVSVTIEDMTVRLATPDAAVVTVTSRLKTLTTPDGVRHENRRGISTFMVVKQNGRWLIMQDQNTSIADRP
jgi:uncharacterized protein (TIGR02246 family)